MKITTADGLAVSMCVKRQRAFCRKHGLSFRKLHEEGLSEEELSGIDDAYLIRVIESKREAMKNGGS